MEATEATEAGYVTVATVRVPLDRAQDPQAIRDAIAATLKAFEDAMARAGVE